MLRVKRDVFDPKFTLGTLSVDGELFGYTVEDTDRKLELGGTKVPKETAIPRGTYFVKLSFSQRFQRVMPEVLNVPNFIGIRFHGGNTAANTEGCILLGSTRTPTGVANCAAVNERLIRLINAMLQTNQHVLLEVT